MTRPTLSVAYATDTDVPQQCEGMLSPAELDRAAEFKSPRRRQQYLLSRCLVRAVLEDHTGSPAHSFTISADERGKPRVEDGPAISISHSRDIVACAVADHGDIGIDVEAPGRSRDVAAIADRYFNREEAEWLRTQPADRFYMLWVLKEAWLKAIGTGIAGGLDRLQCIVTPPDIVASSDDDSLGALRLFELHGSLLGIAATAESLPDVSVMQWRPADGSFISDEAARTVAHFEAG